MPKRKKRKLSESGDVPDRSTLLVAPYDAIALQPPAERLPPRLQAKFNAEQIRDVDTANKTEKALLKLLNRICDDYDGKYEVYNQSLVNHHLSIFAILGMPVDLSAKSFYYEHKNNVGEHRMCTRFTRANQRMEGGNYNFTEIVRLFAWANRATNNYLYSQFGLAVPTFKIERNRTLLFRQLKTLNTLIASRKWRELGRYLNSCTFLHAPLRAWLYTSRTVHRVTYQQRIYRSLRHDMFVSAFFVWQAASLRVLHAEESREWKSSRQLSILRRAVAQCHITANLKVPEHPLLTDGVTVMVSLDEAYMIHHFHEIDMKLSRAHDHYRRPYEAFKLLAQAWCWQQEARLISGVIDPGTVLIDALLEVAEREGSAGVVFALSALRGFMKIAEVVEETASLDRLLAYSIACPRAVRPLAAQLREYGMEEQAEEMIDKAITPASSIHASDPVWLEWAEGRMREVADDDEESHTAIAGVLLAYLDYGSNRLHERAWILLEQAMKGSDSSRWASWWEERAEWWPHFHTGEMEKRGRKARRKVLKRFDKC